MTRKSILIAALFASGVTMFSGVASAAAGSSDTFPNGQSLYGEATKMSQSARVVDVATSRYVNVTYGETVEFVNGAKMFAWTFDGLSDRAVNIAKIAPSGFDSTPLTVYVARDPLTANSMVSR